MRAGTAPLIRFGLVLVLIAYAIVYAGTVLPSDLLDLRTLLGNERANILLFSSTAVLILAYVLALRRLVGGTTDKVQGKLRILSWMIHAAVAIVLVFDYGSLFIGFLPG